MTYLTGIIALVIGLVVSIALHELGHFIPAKRFGILTPQYMIGFGPTLWSRQVGETEVGIKAILLGGYVRMIGMYAPGREGRKTHNRKGELTWAEQARQDAMAEILPGQEDRAFYAKPVWQRLIVMVSGTLVNLVLSLVCVGLALGAIGVNLPTREIVSIAEGSPASAAGIQAGDKVIAVNSEETPDWVSVQAQIAKLPAGSAADITVERGGTSRQITVIPQEINGRSAIGIMPKETRHHANPAEILTSEWEMAIGTAKILVSLPVKLWETVVNLFQPEKPRDPNSVMGIVGMGQVAGQIASAEVPGFGLADKFASFLMLMGSLNLTLFMFNLIPLMPLDGGQAAGAIYEVIRRAWRKSRGLPDLGPVDLARALPVTATVVFVFIAMTVLLIIADILKPV